MDERFLKTLNADRISSRQIDELIGISRGLIADGHVNQTEAEFLQKWLAANDEISNEPLISDLYAHINGGLSDDVLDDQEKVELF
ncbi:hypothetical protein ACLBXM_19860 [Xanthobacteraceae bacterium A53D]